MTSKRRYKYLRALRHILVASLMMASFYVGRWSMNWKLVELFFAVLYIGVVFSYLRSVLREHRRDSQQFREFLRQCEETIKLSTPPLELDDAAFDAMDKAYGYKSYKCPKCGKVSHHPMDLQHRYCAACHEFESL